MKRPRHCCALLTQSAHETFDSQLANSRQHSELVGNDGMPVTRGYTVAKYLALHPPLPSADLWEGEELTQVAHETFDSRPAR